AMILPAVVIGFSTPSPRTSERGHPGRAGWNGAMYFVTQRFGCSGWVKPAAARMDALRFVGALREFKSGRSQPGPLLIRGGERVTATVSAL
ncbi:MAG: hypothetical protein L0Z50_28865, partial [Verrucomicrobiales bacterium]|nr:hypothetical protein [Verrucomicrobiales bacterium]